MFSKARCINVFLRQGIVEVLEKNEQSSSSIDYRSIAVVGVIETRLLEHRSLLAK